MSLFVSNDWNYMYVCNETSNIVRQYALSTPFDISTATQIAQVSTSQTPHQCWLSNDWTKLFVACWNGRCVDEFVMSTPYNLSTATKVVHSYWDNIGAIFFSHDWLLMFLAKWWSWIRKYTLSTPFVYDTSSYIQTTWTWDIRWACISNDWLHFFVFANWSWNKLCEYTLSTPYSMPATSATHQEKATPRSWSTIELVGNLTSDQKYLFITNEYRYLYRLDMPW